MNKKEFRELWMNDELEEVHKELDDSYRHGNYVYKVFKSPDGHFWGANYTVSGDGEEHGIRDEYIGFELEEVVPVEKTITTIEYISKKGN